MNKPLSQDEIFHEVAELYELLHPGCLVSLEGQVVTDELCVLPIGYFLVVGKSANPFPSFFIEVPSFQDIRVISITPDFVCDYQIEASLTAGCSENNELQ